MSSTDPIKNDVFKPAPADEFKHSNKYAKQQLGNYVGENREFKSDVDPIKGFPENDLLPKKYEGYLDKLASNWDNPVPADKDNVTAYRWTGKAIGPQTKGPKAPWPSDVAASDLPQRDDPKLKGHNKWDLGPNLPKNRYLKFGQPVMNLLKIVRKLRDYSKLSEAYREKHLEVEHLTLTIRKLYYILIFIKDQIKSVAEAEDNIHELISTIVQEDTEQWKRFIDKDKLQKLQERQEVLKKDRKKLEQVFEVASKSILRKLKRMGASMSDIVDLNNPQIPDMYGNWDKFKSVDNTNDLELQKLFQEYNKAITGQKQQIEFLLKFPGVKMSDLSENQRDILETEVEKALLELVEQDYEGKYRGQVTTVTKDELKGEPTQPQLFGGGTGTGEEAEETEEEEDGEEDGEADGESDEEMDGESDDEESETKSQDGEGEEDVWDPEIQALGIPGEKSALRPEDLKTIKLHFSIDNVSEINFLINQLEDALQTKMDPNISFIGRPTGKNQKGGSGSGSADEETTGSGDEETTGSGDEETIGSSDEETTVSEDEEEISVDPEEDSPTEDKDMSNNLALEEAVYIKFKRCMIRSQKITDTDVKDKYRGICQNIAKSAEKVSVFNDRWKEESQGGEESLEEMNLPETGDTEPIMLKIVFRNITNEVSEEEIMAEIKNEILKKYPFILPEDFVDSKSQITILGAKDSEGEGEGESGNDMDYGINTGDEPSDSELDSESDSDSDSESDDSKKKNYLNRLKDSTKKLSRKHGLPDNFVPGLIAELKSGWDDALAKENFDNDNLEQLLNEVEQKIKDKIKLESEMKVLNKEWEGHKNKDGDGIADSSQGGGALPPPPISVELAVSGSSITAAEMAIVSS